MPYQQDEWFGKKAKDKITGFEGIITGKVTYMFGCAQYGLTPPVKDGKLEQTHYFDEGRIEIIGEGISPEAVTASEAGGEHSECPQDNNYELK